MNKWQQALTQAITDPHELCNILQLDPETAEGIQSACESFKLRVPRGFVQRMQKGDPHDPLLLQVLPQAQEMLPTPGYSTDPVKERAVNPVPGLLHKYPSRVLLTLIGVCAINCRYCFRRHFPYEENNPGQQGWQQALNYIANDPSIIEVILSGGDPLLVKDNLLQELILKIAQINHVQIIRMHTRLPVVLPERITSGLSQILASTRLKPLLVIHSNHPQELDASVADALKLLRDKDITLLNQTVFLKGINDNVAVLKALSLRLFECGVLPYYLHCLDPVQGAAHFDMPRAQVQALWRELQAAVPGYLLPRLVEEIPGAKSKVPPLTS